MMEIIGSIWFSGLSGHFGIVIINNGFEEKAYLGPCIKNNQEEDELFISKMGAPFPIDIAKQLIK